MLLRHLYLYLDRHEYPDELTTPFSFKTRYLCNFLERKIRPLRFQAGAFSKICIVGRHGVAETSPIVPDNALKPDVAFDEERYLSLGPGDLHKFFIGMLSEGLCKAAREYRIPLSELEAGIEEFRHGGYKNEWVHQAKLLRKLELRATLHCALDLERFTLTLILERGKVTVFSKVILTTKPDEIFFTYRFKEIVLVDDQIRVLNKYGEEIFSVSQSSIATQTV